MNVTLHLYRVLYSTWNNSYSNLLSCEELSVGVTEADAIDRVRANRGRDCRDFYAVLLDRVMGYEILVKSEVGI